MKKTAILTIVTIILFLLSVYSTSQKKGRLAAFDKATEQVPSTAKVNTVEQINVPHEEVQGASTEVSLTPTPAPKESAETTSSSTVRTSVTVLE